jgi:hypothetical protein
MSAHSRHLSRGAAILVAVAALLTGYFVLVWPKLIRWGATDEETQRSIPLSQYSRLPRYESTRAIEIHAPPGEVWQWLVQLGQGRGGMYSYSWLENLVGADIHNVARIRQDLQRLAIGDTVRLAPAGFLGGKFDRLSQLRVAAIVPAHLLVLHGWGTFVLDSLPGGRTRLLIREETPLPASWWRAAMFKLVWEPPHFVMERQMLRGIRDRAEGRAEPSWLSTLATLGFAAMALTIVWIVARRPRQRWWLLWPLAGAATVIVATGDVHAALAGFVGTGTAIAGAAWAGRAWWKWFGATIAAVWLVLLLASDAYLALGWLLGSMTLLVLMATLKRSTTPLPAPW